MKPDMGAPARKKILFFLKTRGPMTAQLLGAKLDVTPMAVRQHLYEMEKEGLVGHEDRRKNVGRPARYWKIAPEAAAGFPDSHAELVVGLIDAARGAFGEEGIQRLVQERTRRQVENYRKRLPATGASLEKKVALLATIRNEEGYMAEWSKDDGAFLLIENHCPICDAARSCQNLCGGEMEVFRSFFGKGVAIERTEHILSGSRRCVYRVSPA